MDIWDVRINEPAPSPVARVLGLQVDRAWLSPEGTILLLMFRNRQTMMVSVVDAINGVPALELTIGCVDPGLRESCDRTMPDRPWQLNALRGRRLTQFSAGGAVLFSGGVGIDMGEGRARWIRRE